MEARCSPFLTKLANGQTKSLGGVSLEVPLRGVHSSLSSGKASLRSVHALFASNCSAITSSKHAGCRRSLARNLPALSPPRSRSPAPRRVNLKCPSNPSTFDSKRKDRNEFRRLSLRPWACRSATVCGRLPEIGFSEPCGVIPSCTWERTSSLSPRPSKKASAARKKPAWLRASH